MKQCCQVIVACYISRLTRETCNASHDRATKGCANVGNTIGFVGSTELNVPRTFEADVRETLGVPTPCLKLSKVLSSIPSLPGCRCRKRCDALM